MSSGPRGQVHRYVQSIYRNLQRLEEIVRGMEAQVPEIRPHDSRSEVLEQIHVAGAVDQRFLFEILDQRSMNHAWIGAQVGAEYLDVWHGADGRTWYRVTDRATRELHLGQMGTLTSSTSHSDSVFWEDWSSEEDSCYDRL